MWDRQLHPHSDAVIVKRIRDAADAGEIEAEKLDQVTKTGNPIWRVDFKKTLAWYLKTYVTKKGKA
jgi:hypothetical protein